MSRFELELRGIDEVRRRLGLAQEALTEGMAAGLKALGENVRGNSMGRAPVDLGVLRNSHYVTEPEVDGDTISLTIGCGGGPAEPYAIVQHERLDLRHPEGEAKFMENAAKEEAATALQVVGNQARAYLRSAVRS